jgi:hypothetical protein
LLLGFLFKLGVSHLSALLLALAKASDKISAEVSRQTQQPASLLAAAAIIAAAKGRHVD